jgi:hypothetical protein
VIRRVGQTGVGKLPVLQRGGRTIKRVATQVVHLDAPGDDLDHALLEQLDVLESLESSWIWLLSFLLAFTYAFAGTRSRRQPTPVASPRSPLRGHSDVRHGERFAGSFRESCRSVALTTASAHP